MSTTNAEPSQAAVGSDGDGGLRQIGALHRLILLPEAGGLASAIVAFIIFAILAGGNGFLSRLGTANWLDGAAELGIVAIPVGTLMMAGEFDLSVGSVAGATSITIAICDGYYALSPWIGVVIAVGIGVAIGLLNGLIVVKTKLPSFIVTLASLLMVAGGALGVANAITGSSSISAQIGGSAHAVFASNFKGFDISIAWCALLAIIASWATRKARFGNWIYATGGDVQAARANGVPTDTVKVILFLCSSLGAVLVGVVETITFENGTTTLGAEFDFTAIAAAVVGGVLLSGGYGSTVGVIFGSLTYGIVSVGVYYLGWDPNLSQLFIGLFMLVAVMANNRLRQLASGRG
jgi:simple sugar transport system permease protein